MRAIAAVATACLLGSGCSWVVKEPSGASVLADVSFAVATTIAVRDFSCGVVNDSSCEMRGFATLIFAGPLVVVGLVAGAFALRVPPEQVDEDAIAGALPERPTDPETLELAHQVRVAVRAGECDAARAAMDGIAARDAEYHIAMLASGALGPCR